MSNGRASVDPASLDFALYERLSPRLRAYLRDALVDIRCSALLNLKARGLSDEQIIAEIERQDRLHFHKHIEAYWGTAHPQYDTFLRK